MDGEVMSGSKVMGWIYSRGREERCRRVGDQIEIEVLVDDPRPGVYPPVWMTIYGVSSLSARRLRLQKWARRRLRGLAESQKPTPLKMNRDPSPEHMEEAASIVMNAVRAVRQHAPNRAIRETAVEIRAIAVRAQIRALEEAFECQLARESTGLKRLLDTAKSGEEI
jgi:hypothetical protein